MENAKTPTGDSTGKITKEQFDRLMEKTGQAKIVAVNEQELEKKVCIDILAVKVLGADNARTTVPGKETPDAFQEIAAARRGANGNETVYENGERVVPKDEKPNKSLEAAQNRVDIERSAAEKNEQEEQKQGRE